MILKVTPFKHKVNLLFFAILLFYSLGNFVFDGKDSQTVKDFVETLEQQNGKKEQVIPFSKIN